MNDNGYTLETKKHLDQESFWTYTDLEKESARAIVEVAYSNPALYRQRDVEHNPDDPTEILVGIAQRLDEEREDTDVNLGQLEYALRGCGPAFAPEQQIQG